MLAAHRDAGRMNLGKTRIREERAFFKSAIRGGHIAAAGIGGKIKNISVTAGSEHDRVSRVLFDLSRTQVAGYDSFGISVDNHQVEHLGLRKHLHAARGDLTAKRLITTE